MSEEGKDDVEKIVPSAEGKVPADKDGKYPEVVPWSKYVGAKESLGNKLKAEGDKVKSLGEQLKEAPNKEEHDKIKKELDDTKSELQKVKDELNQGKEKTATELREALKESKAFTEEELGKMSEAELRAAVKAAGGKPKSLPDISGGGGGGGVVPQGSPLKLARDAYEQSSKNK